MNRVVATLGLLMAFTPLASAQTAQRIIDDYIRVQGGAKALARVHTETLAGSLTEESTGRTGSWSLIASTPNRLYTEIAVGTDREVEAFNGMSAWGERSPEGPRTLTGAAAKEAEAAGRYWNGRFADVNKSKQNAQLMGVEKLRGREVFHVRVKLGPGVTREVFFDAGTHLIAREVSSEDQFDYDDYRPVNGIQTPYRIELHRAGRTYKISLTRAGFNAPVNDSVFNFPRAPGTPLPDIKALMREVSRNQKAIDEMQKEYTCHVTVEEEKAGAKTIREFEVFNIAGEEVRHLIAKEGVPLLGDEKRKEDARFNKEFEKQVKEQARLAADAKKQQKQEEKDEAQISDFLRAESFSNARRERFRGQDVIAVDFGPDPDYKPKKAMESIVQKLTGVMWIDAQAKDVARLEAYFSNSVKIGGGLLASVDKGSGFVFEQARVNEEVWLPSYLEVHVGGRVLFLKAKANEVDRYTDYKKFRADSKIVGVED